MKNKEIAHIFNEIADILELRDENPFKIKAYRRAANNIESLVKSIEEFYKDDSLSSISGVGKDLESKIKEYLETGNIESYETLKHNTPEILMKMTLIQGVGPKTAKLLYDKLELKSLRDLEKKALHHEISGLPGIKQKTEENILKGIRLLNESSQFMNLQTALFTAEQIINNLKKLQSIKNISYAGSLRRGKESIRDIDILVSSKKAEETMDAFTSMPIVKQVTAHGQTKSSIITNTNIQVDLRVIDDSSWGAALVYFTGSKQHNIELRRIAMKKNQKINEYGLFDEKSNKMLAGKNENEVYKTLGLQYIPPELREDQGEIQLSRENKIPKLVELSDVKGDLHVHSNYSDGYNSIEDIAKKAISKGYEYAAIVDHSQTLKIANGLSESKVMQKLEEIKQVNMKYKNIKILAGAEVDVTNDGSLDYPNEILKMFDIVIAAIHTNFKQDEKTMTNRILKAMGNPFVNIFAHPTGRLIGTREPYAVDIDAVIKAAKETNTALEINCYPDRLDLNDLNCKKAKENGVIMTFGSDAHSIDQMDNIKFGLMTARRGYLEKKDVLNCLEYEELIYKLRK
ncbi:DNA polymerase/3'-5' exonuclease PolX [bacterium]